MEKSIEWFSVLHQIRIASFGIACSFLSSCAIDNTRLTESAVAVNNVTYMETAIMASPRVTALTGIESWAPADSIRFKGAGACYDNARDEYAIAAIYTRRDADTDGDWDEAFLLRIDADEASDTYGQLVHALAIGSAPRIDHVDCASDNLGRVYIAFDRYGDHAVWYRYEDTVRHGPYEIIPADIGCHPYSHKPRITVSGGDSPTLFAAFEGYSFTGSNGSGEWESCEACIMAFDALGGVALNDGEIVWNDGIIHGHYDVEWNGNGRFLWALPYSEDLGGDILAVYTYDETGTRLSLQVIQNFRIEPEPPYPRKVELIYTPSEINPHHRIFLITDQGSAYWLTRDGARHGDPFQSEFSTFVACGYLGSDSSIAHTFHPTWNTRDPERDYPVLNPAAVHNHWKTYPTRPRDRYSITDGYFPAACNAGSPLSDDPELLLVGRSAFKGDPKAYWHFEIQH